MPNPLNADYLQGLAFHKRHPAFAKEIAELASDHEYVVGMFKAGRLTQAEYHDFESLLYAKLIDELPADIFQEMMSDGRLAELQALAGVDDTRGVGEAENARAAVYKKVGQDMLDNAWLEQRIDSQTYTEALANLEQPGQRNELQDRIADGDFDGAASEEFAARHDTHTGPENDLSKWIKDKYGEGPKKSEKPPFEVIRETVIDTAAPAVPSFDGIVDLDAPDEEQS